MIVELRLADVCRHGVVFGASAVGDAAPDPATFQALANDVAAQIAAHDVVAVAPPAPSSSPPGPGPRQDESGRGRFR
jgi:hypothetical protein